MDRRGRIEALRSALSERIVVLDGAMGTAIQSRDPKPEDFGGAAYDGCNEHLVLSRPAIIESVHRGYLEAGADVIETDTFGGTPLVLAEYGLADKTREINRAAAALARKVADSFSTPSRPRFVAGSIGPTTKAISVTGGVSFEELVEHFGKQAAGLHEGGADYLLIETAQDARNVKAALVGIERLFAAGAERIPIAVCCTIEASGTMLAGQTVEAFWASVAHMDLLYIGLNCATGPEFMTDHLRTLSTLSKFPVACVPNAGLPDEDGRYLETPGMMASVLERFASSGWVNVIGGCCGTTPEHIRLFAEIASNSKPRRIPKGSRTFVSGIDYVEIDDDKRPLLIGERTNVIGSRKFKKLIEEGQFEAAVEVGRGQVRNGAQVVDVCLANPDRDELADMRNFLECAVKSLRAPVMIDSTDDRVIAMALTYCQGKSIINSINLEDGEERFRKVVPLAKTFGAAMVVGTIDDDPVQGMAIKRDRKLDVARRSYDLLTQKYGVEPEDILWDALVFPSGSGDPAYDGSAVETIEAVRLLKEQFPRTKTLLGISNVSFGLPEAGREILNSVFLYHCTQAGLDAAIVNTGQLRRYPTIPEEERKLAEDLLWNRSPKPIERFTEYFRKKKAPEKKESSRLPLDERLAKHVVDGLKEGLTDDLKEALKNRKPLEIINGPLLKGMDEVGRLFNANELIVAEVLQSAEVMKSAVSLLEPFMEKSETSVRGKVLLATVKGDVHDIGKNLVEIILANNGFQVINLGIKVSPEKLITAIREHSPHIVGLSGLLVKSAHQMVATAEDLSKAGIRIPMLVGGAALSRTFVDRKIARAYIGPVSYASDAMNGLELAKVMVDPEQLETFKAQLANVQKATVDETAPKIATVTSGKRSDIQPEANPPPPPDFDRHVLTNTPLEQIWSFVNPRMLLGRHLGLSNTLVGKIERKEWDDLNDSDDGKKALEITRAVDEVKAECKKLGLLKPKAVYQFIRPAAEGDRVHLHDPSGLVLATLPFPRQTKAPFLCIADYLNSVSGSADNLCLFVVTAGAGVRARADELKASGEYLRSHILSALALETAEAYAEWLHAKIRGMWGKPDPLEMTMLERFQARYTGKRYSFGYPACPDLEGQRALFDLLKPEEIGVSLTETFMMDPEASVSAIAMHHPRAAYFTV
jgi:5-methyltetrahydrofolate--homocysteine methyltransferase